MEGFQSLGDYRDSADQARAATYLQAQSLQESGNYTIARVLYAGLGDYEQSAENCGNAPSSRARRC